MIRARESGLSLLNFRNQKSNLFSYLNQKASPEKRMDKTQEKGQARDLQVKKGNSFHPQNSEYSKEKEGSQQDTQPQWKMGVPSKKRSPGNDESDFYYDQYGYDGYFGMDPAAMGMLTYPYDYMAWVRISLF